MVDTVLVLESLKYYRFEVTIKRDGNIYSYIKMVLERLKLNRMMVITKYAPEMYTNESNNAIVDDWSCNE